MNSKRFFSTLVALFFVLGNLMAQDIISAKDFAKLNKSNKDLVVIDASKAKLYAPAHIKGAISLHYAKLNDKEPYSGVLKSTDELATILGEKGISNTDEIVIYDEGSQKYSTRVYWILKYLGAENVKLLHKHMSEFRNARIPLTSEVPSVSAKTFEVTVNEAIFCDAAYIESVIGEANTVIIDARTPAEFDGTGEGKLEYSNGHIEGAISIPYEDTIEGEDKVFITPEQFQALAPDVEFTNDKTYIVYCKTGVKGATMYAFLKNVMGFENVKLYEGSYLEWEHNEKPVVK
jgi:thiosulfate/3-mercaptopyruvate sulfurtransferase